MAKFKGYSKQATSDKMMRIIKRERILSILLGNASLIKVPEDEAKAFLQRFSKDDKVFDWKTHNLTRMSFYEPLEHKDYFDWKVSLIKETKWLFNPKILSDEKGCSASWQDTKKLRIYRKWLYKGKQFTCEDVLKYMYSPLFLAILVMEKGYINQDKQLEINLGFNHKLSSILLVQWLSDVLNLKAGFKTNNLADKYSGHDVIVFIDSEKALACIEPTIKEIPSKHKQLY